MESETIETGEGWENGDDFDTGQQVGVEVENLEYSHYYNNFNNIKRYLESREMDEVVCELFYFVKREIYPGYFVSVDQQ